MQRCALHCRPRPKRAQTMLAKLPLDELQSAHGMLQKTLADAPNVMQPSIDSLEKRTGM